ncbi:hypothetical protein IFM89_026786 [Coptis chinensis]|uniref:Uncharacterized protein n=1 Tax=Coptis chinensis TaxID=261450 RepID=A0A835H0R0_9MAGN|nr:hypothetical protein IFM89_026786 [Coptis chinensis]
MKKFLKCISCCVPIKRSVVPTSPTHKEEGHGLSPLYSAEGDSLACIKRGKLGSGRAHWRPSLCVISEDNVVSTVSNKAERMVKSGKNLAEKARSRGRIRSCDRSSDNEFRRTSTPVVIPVFSPTGFLF